MSKPKSIFLTGATGFLGSHLAARCLEAGNRVTALARSSKNISPDARVRDVLREVGTAAFENLKVVEGDISLPGLGLSECLNKEILSTTDEIWHCAASLSFQDQDRNEIFHMNVDGTHNVLEFAKRTPKRRLHHVSTAYVAGNRPDIALETEIDVGQTFKNAYEESKCRAELLVSGEQRKETVVASIYRPSIVIGDSRSGRVTHHHGVYAFLRGIWATLERMRRRTPDIGLIQLPLRVIGAENETLNFVPIDFVVDGMLKISEKADNAGGTYHLTNPVPTENRLWLQSICRLLRVEGIELVGQESFLKVPMTKLESLFQRQMAFYYQYLQGGPRFDCRWALDALAQTGIECPPMNQETLDRMITWYIALLSAKAV